MDDVIRNVLLDSVRRVRQLGYPDQSDPDEQLRTVKEMAKAYEDGVLEALQLLGVTRDDLRDL